MQLIEALAATNSSESKENTESEEVIALCAEGSVEDGMQSKFGESFANLCSRQSNQINK